MKTVVPYLKLGDQLEAQVKECCSGNAVIVSLNGDLIRIKNLTGKTLKAGDAVWLKVKTENPLSFVLEDERSFPFRLSKRV